MCGLQAPQTHSTSTTQTSFAAPTQQQKQDFKMLLLDYQNVLIESLLKDRFSGCAVPHTDSACAI